MGGLGRLVRAGLTPLAGGLLLVLLLGVLTLLFPAGFTRDYVNHLARTHIEANIWSDPDLQRNYALSFALIPDLTMDLVIPWLSQLAGTWRAGAITVWMALALPAAAGLLIARTLHGRVTWLSVAGFVTVFGVGAEWGFVNYVASSGLALLAFAVWMRMTPGWRRGLLFAAAGLFLAINHALAFLVFGFLAAVWEVASFAERDRGSVRQFVRRAMLYDLPAALPGLLLIALATMGAHDLPRGTAAFFSFSQKAEGLTSSFAFFNPALGLVIFLALCAVAYGLVRGGYVSMPRKMVWVVCGMLLLNLLIPTSVLGIWGLHLRFTALLVILFFAGIRFTPAATARIRTLSALGITGLIAVSMGNGAWHMARLDRQTGEIRTLLQAMPRGARLLATYQEGPMLDLDFAMHSSAIAVIERSAYVPGLFTNTSPVDVSPANIDVHMPQSLPLSLSELADRAGRPATPSANGYWSPGYANDWPARWDYVILFRGEAGGQIDNLPVCPLAQSRMAVLYRTGRC